jgi:hypothetical protein
MLENAAGVGNHSVCGPSGIWQITADATAKNIKTIAWMPPEGTVSKFGCCTQNQCWDGFKCVDYNSYYTIGSRTFVCR